MIICLDIRALQTGHQNRGIGMFIKSVLEHLPAGENKYILYMFDNNNPIDELGINLMFDYEIVTTPYLKTSLGSPKDMVGLIKLVSHAFKPIARHKPDIFLQFDFTLGLPRWRTTKTFVIGYDLIPLIQKNEYLPSVRFAWQHSAGKRAKLRGVARSVYYRFKYRIHYKVYRRADHIICISKSTAKSFVEKLEIPPEKLDVITLAPVLVAKNADNEILKNVNMPYILYIGGADSRKNVQDVVRAFNIAKGRGTNISLVLAGNEFTDLEQIPNVVARNEIMSSSYRNDIFLVGFVSDSQKKALYGSALAFIFCTSYEGFGLPIIEAMSESCPVISYENSSVPEAAGDAAILVDTGNYVSIARNIIKLDKNADNSRDRLVINGLRQSSKFSWQAYTEKFNEIILN